MGCSPAAEGLEGRWQCPLNQPSSRACLWRGGRHDGAHAHPISSARRDRTSERFCERVDDGSNVAGARFAQATMGDVVVLRALAVPAEENV